MNMAFVSYCSNISLANYKMTINSLCNSATQRLNTNIMYTQKVGELYSLLAWGLPGLYLRYMHIIIYYSEKFLLLQIFTAHAHPSNLFFLTGYRQVEVGRANYQ